MKIVSGGLVVLLSIVELLLDIFIKRKRKYLIIKSKQKKTNETNET